MWTMGSLGDTTVPSVTYTSLTLPARVAVMSFCIFIASRTATVSPSSTLSPTLTGILRISPCIGATIVPSRIAGFAPAPFWPGAAATPPPRHPPGAPSPTRAERAQGGADADGVLVAVDLDDMLTRLPFRRSLDRVGGGR